MDHDYLKVDERARTLELSNTGVQLQCGAPGGVTQQQCRLHEPLQNKIDPLHAKEVSKEIWDDVEVLMLPKTHKYGNGLSAKTRDHIYRHARGYRWIGDKLFKLLQKKVMVVMERLGERMQIALDTHRACATLECNVFQTVSKNTTRGGAWTTRGVSVVKACFPCVSVKSGFMESD